MSKKIKHKRVKRGKIKKLIFTVFLMLCVFTALGLAINKYGINFGASNKSEGQISAKSEGPGVKHKYASASDIRQLESEKKILAMDKKRRSTKSGTGSKKGNGITTGTTVVVNKPKPEDNERGIPVLMYHSIAYEKGNELRVPKENFAQQMKYLKDNGYTTMSLDEVYNYMINKKQIPPKTVAITFDDGYEDNYVNAFPIMKQYGLKGTVFVITKTVDKDSSYLTSKQIKEMDASGMRIESHTVTHEVLTTFDYEKQYQEVADSKSFLEKCLGRKINFLAYPCGCFNSDTINALKNAGYLMAFTTAPGNAKFSQGIYTLRRVRVSADCSLDGFKYLIR